MFLLYSGYHKPLIQTKGNDTKQVCNERGAEWSPNDTDMATKSQGWRLIETGKEHNRRQIYKT